MSREQEQTRSGPGRRAARRRDENDRKRPIAGWRPRRDRPEPSPDGPAAAGPGDDDWTIRFVTDGRSRKASDIRRAARSRSCFSSGAEDAFVALTGAATLLDAESQVRRRWKDAYKPFFPTETDRANAAFLEVGARRLELSIRASRRSRSDCRRRRSNATRRAPGG